MSISGVSDLYFIQRDRAASWLAPDLNGALAPLDPQPMMLRISHAISPLEQDISNAKGRLSNERCWLAALTLCPDGPPYRSALLFTFISEVPRNDGGKGLLYRRAGADYSLGSDDHFYVTGSSGAGSVWRVFRSEVDVLNRWILTLSPVRLSSKCPQADFSNLKTPLLADEVRAQYAALANAIATNSYRAVVTDAKNIVEAIVAEKLGVVEKSRDLSKNLQTIKKLLENDSGNGSCGWTYPEYHLAQKIRLVHGQTHATAPAKAGRPLRPEFALSTVEDLVELLHIWGYCKA